MAAVKVNVPVKTVLDRARSQLGVHEIPYGSNKTPYSVWYGLIGPWCAMFVSWVLYFSGAPLPISTSKGFAYCPFGVDWFKKKGAWAGPNTRPQPGWVIFFDFIGRPSHTGLVEGVAPDGRIIAIEGNTNGSGSRTGGNVMRHYRSVRSGIIGYGMIEYVAPVKPTPDNPNPTVLEEEDDMQHPAEIVQGDGAIGVWFVTDRITKQWIRNKQHAAVLVQDGHKAEDSGTPGDLTGAKIEPYTWPQKALDSIRLVGPSPT